MKYFLVFALLMALLGGCLSQQKNEAGAFCEGEAMGYRGQIKVRVSVDNGIITGIAVVESREDHAVGGAAIDELTDLILAYNSTEVDAVSGATETSKGFLAAVEHAILGP